MNNSEPRACFLEPAVLVLSYKQMFLGLEVIQRTVLFLPGSYTRFKSTDSHLGHPWVLLLPHCCFQENSPRKTHFICCSFRYCWAWGSIDRGCASRKQYVKHKVKQALLSSLRVQLASYKVDLRWCKHLQQLEWKWLGGDLKSSLSFFLFLITLSLFRRQIWFS